VHKLSINTVI